jgi:hypothetical protein
MLIEMFCQHFYLKCVEIRFCCSNFVARITPALTTINAGYPHVPIFLCVIIPFAKW